MGRPLRYTDELGDAILASVRGGNYIETACRLHGVSKHAFYRWLAIANGPAPHKHKARLVAFRDAIEKASAESEAADVARLVGEPLWQATAWRLERKFPSRWGRRVELSGQVAVPVDVTLREALQLRLNALPETELDRHVAALEAGAATLGLLERPE